MIEKELGGSVMNEGEIQLGGSNIDMCEHKFSDNASSTITITSPSLSSSTAVSTAASTTIYGSTINAEERTRIVCGGS